MDESDKELLENIGQLYAEIRKEAGLTQRAAAALAESNQARISYLENGKADIFILTLRRWANIYGYDIEINLVPIQDEDEIAFNKLLAETMSEIEEENNGDYEDRAARVLSEMRPEVPNHGSHAETPR